METAYLNLIVGSTPNSGWVGLKALLRHVGLHALKDKLVERWFQAVLDKYPPMDHLGPIDLRTDLAVRMASAELLASCPTLAFIDLSAHPMLLEPWLDFNANTNLLVFYRSPRMVVVDAMKCGQAPGNALADWQESVERILGIWRRHRNRVLLINVDQALVAPNLFLHFLNACHPWLPKASKLWTDPLEVSSAMESGQSATLTGFLVQSTIIRELTIQLEASSLPIGEKCGQPQINSDKTAHQYHIHGREWPLFSEKVNPDQENDRFRHEDAVLRERLVRSSRLAEYEYDVLMGQIHAAHDRIRAISGRLESISPFPALEDFSAGSHVGNDYHARNLRESTNSDSFRVTRLFKNDQIQSYHQNLMITNEKEAKKYPEWRANGEKRFPKVMVGTMYSGENEFDSCQRSVKRQSYKYLQHVIIKNLGNVAAHNALYEGFLQSDFDLLLKLDADMVILDDFFIEKVVNAFRYSQDIAILQIAIIDFFSGSAMQGINVYSKNFKWSSTKTDKLFTDRSPLVTSDQRRLVWNTFLRSVIHSPSPAEFQAFHFGVHRGVKVLELLKRDNWDGAAEQYTYLERTYDHYRIRRTRNLLMASLGAQVGLTGKFAAEQLDYTNPELKYYFETKIREHANHEDLLLEMRAARLRDEPIIELERIGRVQIRYSGIKRVCFLVPHLQTFGGILRFIELVKELTERGIKSVLGVIDDQIVPERLQWVSQNYGDIDIQKLTTVSDQRWDVVVCGDFSSGLMLTLPEFNTRLTCVYLLNGWQHHYVNTHQVRLVEPDLIVANSSYAASHHPELFPVVIAGGINIHHFESKSTIIREQLDPVRIFIPVGRNRPRKRFVDGYEACKTISNHYKVELHTLCVGGLVDKASSNLIHVHHQDASRSELLDLLAMMDLAIFPEEDAGWNNPVAEAMAVGCPLVCTPAGTTDIALNRRTALVVPPRNAEAMAKAGLELIDSYNLRYNLSRAGRQHIQQFSWSRVCEKLIDAFDESLKASESRSARAKRSLKNIYHEMLPWINEK